MIKFYLSGKDCLDLLHRGFNSSGVYNIDPDGEGAFQVLCDQETNGGGWVVFQKRSKGVVDFNRSWSEYKDGFGNFSTEFWLGNEKLHRLTSSMNQQLLVELEAFNGEKAHANYKTFSIDSESEKYKLVVDGYFGTATDALKPRHNNHKFSTYDQDNDGHLTWHCALNWGGGWWFDNCVTVTLNGPYFLPPNVKFGIVWEKWKLQQLKGSTMKIRTIRGE